MESEPQQSNVFPLRLAEQINGVRLPLAQMSLQRLLEVEATCRTAFDEARTDLSIVCDYIDSRFPGSDGAA